MFTILMYNVETDEWLDAFSGLKAASKATSIPTITISQCYRGLRRKVNDVSFARIKTEDFSNDILESKPSSVVKSLVSKYKDYVPDNKPKPVTIKPEKARTYYIIVFTGGDTLKDITHIYTSCSRAAFALGTSVATIKSYLKNRSYTRKNGDTVVYRTKYHGSLLVKVDYEDYRFIDAQLRAAGVVVKNIID